MSQEFCPEKASREIKGLKKALNARGYDIKLRDLQDAIAESCGHKVWGSIKKLSDQSPTPLSAAQLLEQKYGDRNPLQAPPVRLSVGEEGQYRFFTVFDIELDDMLMSPQSLAENFPFYIEDALDKMSPRKSAFSVEHKTTFFHLPDIVADLEEQHLFVNTANVATKVLSDGERSMINDLVRLNRANREKLEVRNDPELADEIDYIDALITGLKNPGRNLWTCPGEDHFDSCGQLVLDDENGKCTCDACGAIFTPCLEFHYHLEYFGGGWEGDYEIAEVPVALINNHGYEKAFEKHTGHNKRHIIFYESDQFCLENSNSDFYDGEEIEPISAAKRFLK